jgi:hypothetical protein
MALTDHKLMDFVTLGGREMGMAGLVKHLLSSFHASTFIVS